MTETTEPAFEAGMTIKFKGYSQDEENPLLQPGQLVKIRVINPDGALVVDMLDENGKVREDVSQTETLFPEEVEMLTPDETAEPQAEVKAEAKPKKGGIKPSAKAKAEAKPAKAKKGDEVGLDANAGSDVQLSADETTVVDTGPRSALVRAAIQSVTTAETGEGAAALKAAKALVNRVDETYYTLGGVLAYVKETGVYKSLGYDGKRGFADYCHQELATDYRKAQYLIEVFDTVQQAGLNEARLSEIGWSKAVQIIRVGKDVSMDKLSEDFDTLIDFAKDNNRDDLISHIKTTYEGINTRSQGSGTGAQLSKFNFVVSAEMAAQCESALTTAKSLAGSDDLNAAFQYILNDWMMMTSGTSMDEQTALDVLEHRFGKKFIAAPAEAAQDQGAGEEAQDEVATEQA